MVVIDHPLSLCIEKRKEQSKRLGRKGRRIQEEVEVVEDERTGKKEEEAEEEEKKGKKDNSGFLRWKNSSKN